MSMFFLFCYVSYEQFAEYSTDSSYSTVHVVFFCKKLKHTEELWHLLMIWISPQKYSMKNCLSAEDDLVKFTQVGEDFAKTKMETNGFSLSVLNIQRYRIRIPSVV